MGQVLSTARLRDGRVAFAFVALFAVNSAALAWLPVWLADEGLSGQAVGLVMAATMLARFLAAPAGGLIADGAVGPRPVLIGCGLALLIAYGLLPFAQTWHVYAGAALLMGVGVGPAVPVLEINTVRLAREGGAAFGPMRAVGSLTFIVTTAAVGGLVGAFGTDVTILWMIVGSTAFALSAAAVPVPRAAPSGGPRALVLPALLTAPMLLALAASMLIQASHAFYYGFASLVWRDQGLSPATIGALWAWGTGAEIAVLWFARRAEPLGAGGLLAVGAVCALLRWGLTGLEPGLAGLILLQALHAGTFGAAHLGFVQFVRDHAPPHVAATAQSVNSALTFGAPLAAATAVSGLLYEQAGAAGYFAMTLPAAGGLAAALVLRARLKSEAMVKT